MATTSRERGGEKVETKQAKRVSRRRREQEGAERKSRRSTRAPKIMWPTPCRLFKGACRHSTTKVCLTASRWEGKRSCGTHNSQLLKKQEKKKTSGTHYYARLNVLEECRNWNTYQIPSLQGTHQNEIK